MGAGALTEITHLELAHSHSHIIGATFQNCHVHGPAVILLMNDNILVGNYFEEPELPVVTTVRVFHTKRTTFSGCRFDANVQLYAVAGETRRNFGWRPRLRRWLRRWRHD